MNAEYPTNAPAAAAAARALSLFLCDAVFQDNNQLIFRTGIFLVKRTFLPTGIHAIEISNKCYYNRSKEMHI